MKRYYFQCNNFIDEFNRVWKLSGLLGCPKWELTNEVAKLPKDFEYIEYVPRYAM